MLVENVPFGSFRNCFSWKKSQLFIALDIKEKEKLLHGVNSSVNGIQ